MGHALPHPRLLQPRAGEPAPRRPSRACVPQRPPHRYWGGTEHHPCLQFELCDYQAIDFAIREGLQRVEAGAQGEHKLARGYLPVETRSLHWISDPGFRKAVKDFVETERRMVRDENAWLSASSPFKKSDLTDEIEEHD